MFKLYIEICTDEDFSYKETEFGLHKSYEEETFYFEDRKDAVDALIRSYHSLRKSLEKCNYYFITDWVNDIDDHLELISNKFATFDISKDFGCYRIMYILAETKKVINDKYYKYEDKTPEISLFWRKLNDNNFYMWDKISKLPDLSEFED